MQKQPEYYMKRAIALAKKGMGYTSPNPMVGCVVVKDGRIISEGYHERCGAFHAERNALLCCEEDTNGAELYVTLEPCCHYGKTPPCTEIIMEKGIAKVYVGAMDSNPLVAGKGIRILREAGIQVETGILEEECRRLNEVFFHYMEKSLPFVAMKYAMTLDGKIACESGDSKWVTGEAARAYVQQLRKRYTGIMVGIETVLLDDPMLTCRIAPECNPIRIICDSRLRIPLDSNIVKTAKEVPTYVAYSTNEEGMKIAAESLQYKISALQEAGVNLIVTSGEQVNLPELMQELTRRKVDSILLEGGGTLNASMLKNGLVNRVHAFISPKLVGGAMARSPVAGMGVDRMEDAYVLQGITLKQFGDDILISGLLKEGGC